MTESEGVAHYGESGVVDLAGALVGGDPVSVIRSGLVDRVGGRRRLRIAAFVICL